MGIAALAHFSIRTRDLDASERFYVDVLGFRIGPRPPFNFPGRWIYLDDDVTNHGAVHLVGTDEAGASALDDYLGAREMVTAKGTGAIDHIAFSATGWPQMRQRLEQCRISYREMTVPELGLHQVFLQDPSGIVIELNYPASEGPLRAG